MVKVKSSKGGMVNVEVLGISAVLAKLTLDKKRINKGADFGVVRAGAFIEEEVKESVIGNRAELKSVDTGLFANSIEFDKTGEAEGIVKAKPESYPNSSSTTEEVSDILEYGTSRIQPRSHFRNTAARNKGKVKDIIQTEINQKLR